MRRGLSPMRLAVGERRHIPARHGLPSARCWATLDCEWAGRGRRCSSRAITPRRRRREPSMLPAVMRRSSATQLEHDGPGGATIGAATTTCPHAAVYRPWPATSPAVVARSLTRWSRPSTTQVIVMDREVFLRRICSTVGMAALSCSMRLASAPAGGIARAVSLVGRHPEPGEFAPTHGGVNTTCLVVRSREGQVVRPGARLDRPSPGAWGLGPGAWGLGPGRVCSERGSGGNDLLVPWWCAPGAVARSYYTACDVPTDGVC